MNEYKVYFIGAGSGDPELITLKAKRLLEESSCILYTGSLVPAEITKFAPPSAKILSSEEMNYAEIFAFFSENILKGNIIRLHTGDPSIYSTIAKQIEYLKLHQISYEVIPGVTAAFAAAASLGIEYTIPGVSQSLIITRIHGNTPNPQSLESLLSLKSVSFVFYLSIQLLKELYETATNLDYHPDTPCIIVYRASMPDQKIWKTNLKNLKDYNHIVKGHAIVMFGEFLFQKEKEESVLYGNKK